MEVVIMKVYCDKCNGKGFYYEYGHNGETEYYHECDKCKSAGYIFVEDNKENRLFFVIVL